jgi:NADH dehydrogenase
MPSREVFRDMVERDAVVDPEAMKELFPHVSLTPVRELIRRMKERNADLSRG